MKRIRRITSFILYYAILAMIYFIGFELVLYLIDVNFYPWEFGILYYYLVSVIFALFIFVQKRHQSAKLSWFLVLVLVPVIGQIIFLVFGMRYKHRRPLTEYYKKPQFAYEQLYKNINPTDDDNLNSLLAEQTKISHRGTYKADIKFYSYQDEGFEQLFEDLKNAKKFIHLEYYILKPGETFEQLRSILYKKVKEGVEVRFIIDDFGQWGMPTRKVKEFKRNGINVRILNPINFPFVNSNTGFRTHKKFVVIDGEIVHTGGANIADEYLHTHKKWGWWIDYHAKITGEFVRSYNILFLQDWDFCGGPIENEMNYLPETSGGNSYASLIEETPENEEKLLLSSYVKWVFSAKKSIKISTPYFVPVPEVFHALKTAALSGIKVQIFIPGKADKKSAFLASTYYANELSKFGVEFYQVKSMLIHSKLALFDEKYAYFGTANVDYRSIHSQFETANLLVGPDVAQIKAMFEDYEKLVHKVIFENPNKPYRVKWYIRVFVQVFSPMM